MERLTHGYNIHYYVNPHEFSQHPIAAEIARAADKSSGSKGSGPELQKFEGKVEKVYVQDLYDQCQRGLERRNQRKEEEIGFFGLGTDWEKVRKIEQEKVESCDRLRGMGLIK